MIKSPDIDVVGKSSHVNNKRSSLRKTMGMIVVNYAKHTFVGYSKAVLFAIKKFLFFYPLSWFTKLQKIENSPWSLPKISYRKLQSTMIVPGI